MNLSKVHSSIILCWNMLVACILVFFGMLFLPTAYAQTANNNDQLCREAIPSMALRHLRTSRFTFFDAVNDQISTRYSEFLDPTFGGYAIHDNISSIVDNPSSINWHSVSYATGNRNFSICKGAASVFNVTSGVDTLLSDQEDIVAGVTFAINTSSLNVDNHPIANRSGADDKGSTNTNGQSLITGVYAAYMTRMFNISAITSIHKNDITLAPEGITVKTPLNDLLGFTSQIGTAFRFTQGAINHEAGLYIAYESAAVDALSVTTQGNVQIDYASIDVSTVIPSARWQSSAYYATNNPGKFFGWKGVVNARRVYPTGPTTWNFSNLTTGDSGIVNLDSEWTELAFDGTITLRSIHSQEIYASVSYKSVFGEHTSQKIGGEDITLKLGIQLLF